jgi:hypothetical protein
MRFARKGKGVVGMATPDRQRVPWGLSWFETALARLLTVRVEDCATPDNLIPAGRGQWN